MNEAEPDTKMGAFGFPRTLERAVNVGGAPYVVAALTAAAFAPMMMFAIPRAVSVDAVLLLFAPSVLALALWAGLRPGLALTALGVVLGVLLSPDKGFSTSATAALFAALGVSASFAGDFAYRERRQRQAAARVLEEREAHLRSIFDTAPEAMIVIDAKGVIRAYGASAERLFGWRPDDVIGRNISVLMPQPYREQHNAYLERYFQTGEKRIIGIGRIVVGQRNDGATFPMELTVGEVRSEHGRFFTGFVRDLTERQEREARVRELQAEVVHISRISAMGEMASALAHELNQPLSAIANYLSGARRLLERAQGGDPRAVDALDKAAEQALRAGGIIRRLRDFLARGEGERALESMAKLVHDACGLALVGAKESNIEVHYDLDAHLDRVVVDRIQIEQVIVNLVRNALDAMRDQQSGALNVSTAIDKDMAVVTIADTGPGLDPAVSERLFQPFVTTKPQGMGVGLSISRTIVESHGGRIWVEPNPGGGAVFRFSVRLATDEDRGGGGLA